MKVAGWRCLILAVLCIAKASLAVSASVAVGAIPGNFDVTLSGSSSYSIPIKIAPGAAGTQPQVQLNYDSQTLGGPLGAGWSLGGLSVITRGSKDQFVDQKPGGINFVEDDALYLDGQRLIKIQRPIWGDPTGLYYRKTSDDLTQIVRYGASLDSSYFVAKTKGGVTIVYGDTGAAANSTVMIQRNTPTDKSSHVLAFAQSAVIDTAGNFIEFHYNQNGKGDYNIGEILYTGHGVIDDKGFIKTDANPFASLTFLYTSVDKLNTHPAGHSTDVYVSGALIHRDAILTDLYSCVSNDRKDVSYPFDCKTVSANNSSIRQAAHYRLDYQPTDTASRLVLTSVHMFGADETTEISPTRFIYSPANPGWDERLNFLPSALTLAGAEHIAKGYRFARVDSVASGGLDLLFAAQINGKNVSFAFKNAGPSAWTPGAGTGPWTDDGKTDPQTSQPTGFAPPVPFVDEDGSDLGVLVADIDGSGRAALLQSDVRAGQPARAAYLAGAKSYESHPEYMLPSSFVVSRDGKAVANYRFAKWTGGSGPDIIYETDSGTGFLQNRGPGANLGWKELNLGPPITLGPGTHLVDLDCSGGPPALVGPATESGIVRWQVWRFVDISTGWQQDTDPKWIPPFAADTDPEAVREIRFDGLASKCAGLIVSSAKTGARLAIVPSASGWKSVDAKTPPFDLVNANGQPSKALVANLKGDGYDGIVANTLLPDGSSTAFAYIQDSTGWQDATGSHVPSPSNNFVPDAALSSLDPSKPVISFIGPIAGAGGDAIAILNDQRVTSSNRVEQNRQFGKFYINTGTSFSVQISFAPPIQFATADKSDLGVRFIDLHGTGLPDAMVSRLVTAPGRTYLVSQMYRNTGHGWVAEPGHAGDCTDANQPFDMSKPIAMKDGLCPPIPFAGSDLKGNPVQFVDLDGDGYVDMIFSYKDKSGHILTKVYFNESDGGNGRKWVDAETEPEKLHRYLPSDNIASVVFPLAASDIGDLGVRFVKFDASRVGILKSFRAGKTVCQIQANPFPHEICNVVPGDSTRKAYVLTSTGWQESPSYTPPIDFSTQYGAPDKPAIDLFLQFLSVDGSGLPSIVANFVDPVTQAPMKGVWLNKGDGWDGGPGENHIDVPERLDLAYYDTPQSPQPLVQFVDVNGDGIPDIVVTKRGCPACSKV